SMPPGVAVSDHVRSRRLFWLVSSRKKSEHFTFPRCPSFRKARMAGQSILGEIVLNPAKASEAAAETIEGLISQHALLVYRLAYSILRNHHDAEDAAQECFLRVWKWRDRLHQVRNPKTWLARIAWTAALDRRSRRAAFGG